MGTSISAIATVITAASGIAPGEATNLVPSNIKTDGLTLTWDAPTAGSPEFKYTVQWQLGDNGAWTNANANPIIDQTLAINGLRDNAQYNLRVVTTTPYGTSISGSITITTAAILASAPTDLIASGITETGLTLSWRAPSTGSHPLTYHVLYRENGTTDWIDGAQVTDPVVSTSLSGLTAGTDYDLAIRADNAAGEGALSVIIQALTTADMVAPSAPVNLTASNITGTSVTLTWDQPAVGSPPYVYQVQYSQDGSSWTLGPNPSDPTHSATIENLIPGTQYQFKVFARNQAGTSPWSAIISATTTSTGPTRKPWLQPGSNDSVWNTPIGSGAQWSVQGDADQNDLTRMACALNYGDPWGTVIFIGQASDPLVTFTYNDHNNQQTTATFRCPESAFFGPTSDKNFFVYDLTQPTRAIGAGGVSFNNGTDVTAGVTCGQAEIDDICGILEDAEDGNLGFNVSFGTIRHWELDPAQNPSGRIQHMLRWACDASMLLNTGSWDQGIAWPQARADWGEPGYTGNIQPGATIGIPSTVDLSTLGLTQGGMMLARALQEYGALWRDVATGGVVFYAEYQDGGNPLLAQMQGDCPKILPYLRIMRNQGPTSKNGGGTPLIEGPPPIDPAICGGATAPGAVTDLATPSQTESSVDLTWTAPSGSPPFTYLIEHTLTSILAPEAVPAATLFVSTSGSDSNDGKTQAAAFATIAHAASVAVPGDVIQVAAGSYDGSFSITCAGTADQPIIFRSETLHGAKIVTPASNTAHTWAWTIGSTGSDGSPGAYVTVDGFEIDGTTTGTPWQGGFNCTGNGAKVRRCYVHDITTNDANGGAGILLDGWYGGHDLTAERNIVENIGWAAPATGSLVHGIYLSTTGTVQNNLVLNNDITSWHGAHDMHFVNNTIVGDGSANSNAGILVGSGDITDSNSGGAHYDTGGNTNSVVFNNIIVRASVYGIEEEQDTGTGGSIGTNYYANNLFFESGTSDYLLLGANAATGTITGDPQFKNASGDDYSFASGSPAFGAGLSSLHGVAAPARDINGNDRVTRFDIGAFKVLWVDGPTVQTPSATVPGLEPATSYDFRVIASNGSGTGAPSSAITVTTHAAAQAASGWDAASSTSSITVSSDTLTATAGAPAAGASQTVVSSASRSSGKVQFEVKASTLSQNLAIGLVDSSFYKEQAGGLGADAHGVGIYLVNPALAIYFNGAGNFGAQFVADQDGTTVTICADLNLWKFWAICDEMETLYGVGAWNNGTGNPETGAGGIDITGLTGSIYAAANSLEAGSVCVINTGGSFKRTVSGFDPFDATGGGSTQTAPGQVTGLAVSSITQTTIALSWQQATGSPSITYTVQQSPHGANAWATVTTTSNLNAVVGNLTADTTYDFRVFATNGAGQGPASAIITGTTASATPTTPPLVTAPLSGTVTAGTWTDAVINGMPYSILLPAQFDASNTSYPLLLCLHESRRAMNTDGTFAGTAPVKAQWNAWVNTVAFRTAYPCIVALPALDQSTGKFNDWGGITSGIQEPEKNLVALVNYLKGSYHVWPDKVLVTGNGMGAVGAIELLINDAKANGRQDKLFTSGLALGGANFIFGFPQPNPDVVTQFQSIPFWAVNGKADSQVSNLFVRNLYTALGGTITLNSDGTPADPQGAEAPNGPMKLTLIQNIDGSAGSDVWDISTSGWQGYLTRSLWDWLFGVGKPLITGPLTGTVTQGTWEYHDIPAAGIYGGQFHFALLRPHGYSPDNEYAVLVYEHQNNEGNNWYFNKGDPTTNTIVNQDVIDGTFNSIPFRTDHPCIVIVPFCDQTDGQAGGGLNFGGYADTPGQNVNENAVVAAVKWTWNNLSCHHPKTFIMGQSLGGTGTLAAMLDFNAYNGPIDRIYTAGLCESGQINRTPDPTQDSATVNRMASVPVLAIAGSGDDGPGTGANNNQYERPMWRNYAGNSNYPPPPGVMGGSLDGCRAGASKYHYAEDTTLNHNTWNETAGHSYGLYPNDGKWAFDWLFAQTSTPKVKQPESADKTTITADANGNSSGSIVDAGGNVWTIVGGQVAENDIVMSGTSNVIEMAYVSGTVWQENSSNLWWYHTTDGGWAPTAGQTQSPLASTPTATGSFVVSDGRIYDPNGNQFIARGINLNNEDLANAAKDAQAGPLTTMFRGINFVRISSFPLQAPDFYSDFLQKCAANKILVEIERHPWPQERAAEGQTLTDECNAMAAIANANLNNPYVCFGSTNEPQNDYGSDEINITNEHTALYNAIRNTGSNHLLLFQCGVGGGNPGTLGVGFGMDASAYTSMKGIVWTLHYYGWIPEEASNPPYNTVPASQATATNCLIGSVNGNDYIRAGSGITAAQTITSADGTVPVIIDEWGNGTGSTGGPIQDGNQTIYQIIQAVTKDTCGNYTSGYSAWAWNPGDSWEIMTLDNNTPTQWGQAAADAILATSQQFPATATTITPKTIVDFFSSIKGSKTVSSQFIECDSNDGPNGGKRPYGFPAIEDIHTSTGKWLGGIGIDFYHYNVPGAAVLDAIPRAIDYWNNGGLIILQCHAPNPTTGGGVADVSDLDAAGLLTSGTATNNALNTMLSQIADGIKQLTDAGVVPIFRPWHENDGGWFWWGTGFRLSSDQLKSLWRYTYDYVTKTRGLTNIVWAFTGTADLTNYPGDDVADLVGIDSYTDTPDTGELPSRYTTFQSGAPSRPFILAEFGFNSTGQDEMKLIDAINSVAPNTVLWQQWWSGGDNAGMDVASNVAAALSDPRVLNRGDFSLR